MSIVGKRKGVADVSTRIFTVSCSDRNLSIQTPKREFSCGVPKREFGVAIIGWRLWGQTDIWPFSVGGADSTKTFGELP